MTTTTTTTINKTDVFLTPRISKTFSSRTTTKEMENVFASAILI